MRAEPVRERRHLLPGRLPDSGGAAAHSSTQQRNTRQHLARPHRYQRAHHASFAQASCHCINDFFGDLCGEEAGGNCVPNPCENGGTCAMEGFPTQREVCTCVGGFMGDECEREPGGGH